MVVLAVPVATVPAAWVSMEMAETEVAAVRVVSA